MSEFLLNLLKLVGSAIPIFTGFLYYIGRRFAESYYEVLGVPHEALNLSVADYLFRSVQSWWTFLTAIALTYLVFLLLQSVFRKAESVSEIPSQVSKKKSASEVLVNIGRTICRAFRPRKGDPQLLMLGYVFYSIFALIWVLVLVLPTAELNFNAEGFIETAVFVPLLGSAVFIMTDQPTMNFVRARKRLKQAFIGSIIFVVIVSMQLLPHGIGRLAGIVQTNPYRIERYFPSINITANKPLWSQDIEWIEQDGMYETQDRLILILENNDGLFVKKIMDEEISEVFTIKKISETYYIPSSNVEGLIINYTG
jgi:hypothetical protein